MKQVIVRNNRLEYDPIRPTALGLVLTSFHVLLLYPDKIVGISVLNAKVAFIYNYDEVSTQHIMTFLKLTEVLKFKCFDF